MFFNQIIFFPYLFLGMLIFKTINSYNNNSYAIYFLIIYSSIFYIINDPQFFLVLFISICINYFFVIYYLRKRKKFLIILPIILNVLLILFFKYFPVFSNKSIDIYNVKTLYIPLGISFFTFQQISFIVDLYDKKIKKIKFNEYALYIIFFPQLVAGPIVKFNQVIHYFRDLSLFKDLYASFAFIVIGLFKKIVLADNIGSYSDNLFNSLNTSVLSFFEAWIAVLLFSFQIYFDFSAYSDLAIGIALLFGVKLPENFYSPYKATNLIEFWKRWHISLSQFIKDYLYIKLGGSRNGLFAKHFNIIFSMAICGVWHGTGINFLIWGVYHGIFISINHFIKSFNFEVNEFISCFSTFFIVIIGFAIFRCGSYESLINLLQSLFLFNGLSLPMSLQANIQNFDFLHFTGIFPNNLLDVKTIIPFIIFLFFIIFFCENSQNLIGKQFYTKYGNYNEKVAIINISRYKNHFFYLLGFLLFICSLCYSSGASNFIYFVF